MNCCTVFVLLLAIFAVQATIDVKEEWEKFKQRFPSKERSIITDEESRFKIFANNVQKIIENNALFENGSVLYKTGVTIFSDLSQDQFKLTALMDSTFIDVVYNLYYYFNFNTYKPANLSNLPETVDWREKGAVTPIKYQGTTCAACWAFSAIGALESQYYLKSKKLVSLSEQDLIDCSSSYGNNGCKSGFMPAAFKYIQRAGINNDTVYPFVMEQQNCTQKSSDNVLFTKGYTYIERENEKHLQAAVANVGPIAVPFDGSGEGFDQYTGGIYSTTTCKPNVFNHAVVIIGYGTENNVDYWLVKNSWGTQWGDNGYFKIIRNKNMCGIASVPSFPNL